MTSQPEHRSLTFLVNSGLSWVSYRAVLASGRSTAFFPLPPLPPLSLELLSSPHPAKTAAAARTNTQTAASANFCKFIFRTSTISGEGGVGWSPLAHPFPRVLPIEDTLRRPFPYGRLTKLHIIDS